MSRSRIIRSILLLAAGSCGLLASACGDGGSDDGAKKAVESSTVSSQPAKKAAPAKAADENTTDGTKLTKAPSPPALREAPESMDLPPDDPILGPVLVISGDVIPHDVVRKQIVRGSAGRSALELAKLECMINQEIARRVENGASIEDFRVSDKEIQETIQEEEAALAEQYPDDDIRLEDLVGTAAGELPNQVMVTKLFMKVFLPEVHPNEYPAVTLAALSSTDQGKLLLDGLKSEWEASQDGEVAQDFGSGMFHQLVFQTLNEYLVETSDVLQGDDVPSSVVMRINGDDITVDEIWNKIKGTVSSVDVRSAKQWIVNMTLLERDLGDDWLSEEEAAAKYAEHSDPYKDSMFSVEKVALMIKKYPSVDQYKEFRRAYDSYQRRIKERLEPEALQDFAQKRTMQLIGQSQVDVDVILLSAYDFKRQQWKENGWEDAAKRATEVIRRLTEEGADWDEMVEQYSEFYDPPLPENFEGQTGFRKSKGRFRAQTRNQLMQLLEESELWHFLNGNTITDYCFFMQKVGETATPMRGPHGWYIPRLLRRNVAPERVGVDKEQLMDMAAQDYTLVSMALHCQKLIEENEVYGL